MKKAAILSIAAFYLLLTTGMFVCMVHCAAESFFQPKMAMHNAGHDDCDTKQHKHGAKDKDCACCNKHGNYTIKENIKPALDFQAPQVAVIFHQFNYTSLKAQYPAVNRLVMQYGKAPPGVSGKSISIQLHSLQI
jgi:hypothetical protein